MGPVHMFNWPRPLGMSTCNGLCFHFLTTYCHMQRETVQNRSALAQKLLPTGIHVCNTLD